MVAADHVNCVVQPTPIGKPIEFEKGKTAEGIK
jgi:hypothetical protein